MRGTQEIYSVIEKIYRKENAEGNCKLYVFPDKPHYFDKKTVFTALKDSRKS